MKQMHLLFIFTTLSPAQRMIHILLCIPDKQQEKKEKKNENAGAGILTL